MDRLNGRVSRIGRTGWLDGSVGWDGRVGAANRLGRTAAMAVVWTLLLKSKNELDNRICLLSLNFMIILGIFFNWVYYWTQTFLKGIALFKSSSEKDACFSCERCKNWICGNCLPKTFFDYSDMSLTWTLNLAFFDHSDMSH
ncbi:hypothetical protein BpHYR1_008984 [Brachionus plicatilis]|uniref:Uncharacterized protein n=1 Tax=Brachionus plicatilis TaxID=10195 RepID=A0A3M7RLK5_BRAPC|nr:hypothetical protein BpHYR1_008984 [Brachionus plicatilis]